MSFLFYEQYQYTMINYITIGLLVIVYSDYTVMHVRCTMYAVYCTVYTVLHTVYVVRLTMYAQQCITYNVRRTTYSVQCSCSNICTRYNVRCTMYNVPCNVSRCTVYTVQRVMCDQCMFFDWRIYLRYMYSIKSQVLQLFIYSVRRMQYDY